MAQAIVGAELGGERRGQPPDAHRHEIGIEVASTGLKPDDLDAAFGTSLAQRPEGRFSGRIVVACNIEAAKDRRKVHGRKMGGG